MRVSHSGMPSVVDAITKSINIMQLHITHGRLAGEPAHVVEMTIQTVYIIYSLVRFSCTPSKLPR